jgi:hypothetical protein
MALPIAFDAASGRGFAGTIAPQKSIDRACHPVARERARRVLSFEQDGQSWPQARFVNRAAIRNGPCMIGAHAAQNLAASMVDS